MSLYSWFSRIDKKPNIKTVKVNNNLLQASKTIKYIENYTMWPTATIKPNVEIIPPNYSDLDNQSLNNQTPVLSPTTLLTVIKS
jgi:hypothetical protein